VTVVLTLAALLAAAAAVALVWRYAYFCPSWLVPLLENPYVEAVAGAALLLRRAGVRPGMRVLDAGCGPGRIALPAATAVGPTGHVVALDLQAAMLDKLQRRVRDAGVGNVTALRAGLGAGALPAEEFDVAFLVTVLGEVPDKVAALREIHRALRAGGVLSVTEVLPDPHYQRLRRVRALARQVGFRECALFRGAVSYTINLEKDAVS
jgi:ubiquinone/menaquinone biosynthesis C-methylase UbiE